MELSNLGGLLRQLEFSLSVSSGAMTQIEGNIDGRLNIIKVNGIIKSLAATPIWLDYSQVSSGHYESVQLDLLGNFTEPILILKLNNAQDDLYYIFKFKRAEHRNQKLYGETEKELMEIIVKMWLSDFVNFQNLETENFKKYFQVCKNQLLKIDYLNNELSNRNAQLNKLLNVVFNFLLKSEISSDIKISLSDSAIEYLQSANITLEEMTILAKDSFKTARSLYPSSSDIRIRKYYFNIPELSNPELKNKNKSERVKPKQSKAVEKLNLNSGKVDFSSIADEKLLKTMAILDRYEVAVKNIIENKLPVMGKNIASACQPPISPPALTDSINKHKGRIILCLQKYPTRWVLLRNNYQVIRKILISN